MRGVTFTLEGNGESITFDTSGHGELILRPGATGMSATDITYAETDARGIPGSQETDIDVPARKIFLPLEINGTDSTDWLRISEKLIRITNPFGVVRGVKAPGVRLTVRSPWGGERYIIGKREFSESEQNWEAEASMFDYGRETIGLRLRCFQPFFRSAPVTEIWRAEPQPNFFDDERADGDPDIGFPFELAASQEVNVARDFAIKGDAPAFPTWEMMGRLTYVMAKNITTGETWRINRIINEGDKVTVRTDPNRAGGYAFEGPGNTNWYDATVVHPDLWMLNPGTESILLQLDSPSPAAMATMTYEPQWFGSLGAL